MNTQLQIAIDTFSKKNFFISASLAVTKGADIIEIGTPTIISHGLKLLADLRKIYPGISIYADLKSIDFTKLEATAAFEKGANIVSVLLNANDENIVNALEVANSYKGQIFFSTMGYPQDYLIDRVERIKQLGGRFFIAHGSGTTLENAYLDLLSKYNNIKNINNIEIIAAGGISMDNLDNILRELNPCVVIVGRGAFATNGNNDEIINLKKIISKFNFNRK